jgi:23S rRNA (uracil1939-C5)-methyltransferase
VLYSTLKSLLNLDGNEILFDLYSGVGSIGIFLSKNVKKVYGIEIEKEAVKMANINLAENDISNAEYIAGSVEEKIEEFKKRNIKPDIIVVDPPRRGLDDKTIEYILAFNPKKIGYISCNPSTFARDLKKFEEKYNILEISPVDMFPHTSHVESVCVLNKR